MFVGCLLQCIGDGAAYNDTFKEFIAFVLQSVARIIMINQNIMKKSTLANVEQLNESSKPFRKIDLHLHLWMYTCGVKKKQLKTMYDLCTKMFAKLDEKIATSLNKGLLMAQVTCSVAIMKFDGSVISNIKRNYEKIRFMIKGNRLFNQGKEVTWYRFKINDNCELLLDPTEHNLFRIGSQEEMLSMFTIRDSSLFYNDSHKVRCEMQCAKEKHCRLTLNDEAKWNVSVQMNESKSDVAIGDMLKISVANSQNALQWLAQSSYRFLVGTNCHELRIQAEIQPNDNRKANFNFTLIPDGSKNEMNANAFLHIKPKITHSII
jgi:hypothetical protein